jgi:hypothetical protein
MPTTVEIKPRPNAMLAHLLNHDGSDEEPRRRGDLADELFREIKRRAGNNG